MMTILNNLSIKMRLIAVLCFMSVLLLVCGGVGLHGMSSANRGLAGVYEDRVIPITQLTSIDQLLLRSRVALGAPIMRPDDNPQRTREELRQRAAEVEQNLVDINRTWDAFIAADLSAQEAELAEQFNKAFHTFAEQGLGIALDLMGKDLIIPAQIHWVNAVNTLYYPVAESVTALIDLQVALAQQAYEESNAMYGTIRGIAIAGIFVGVLLAALMGYLLVRAIVNPMNEAIRVAGAIAKGDLTNRIEVRSNDETGRMLAAMKEMSDRLAELVTRAAEASGSVGTGAREIAAGNMNLSQRTEEQASSLEETASSMEELTSTVKQNADNARQANQLANAARESAERGGDVVANAVAAMSEINVSSRKVADIVGVIDEIAFQTNLLALNAAVEAARAGEQGRGFAVVAAEVRNLAQRSAASAKEIKSLIGDSVKKVDDGAQLVHQSGETLADIVASVKKVTDIVAEIAAASQEQAAGIDQVNRAVMQMDEMTQQNAALVEEAAAASRSMEEQAEMLNELMGTFKVHGMTAQRRGASASRIAARATGRAPTPETSAPPPGFVERRGENRPWSNPSATGSLSGSLAGPAVRETAPAAVARGVSRSGDEWQEF
jgi:methyl-accepting chemotaxis protein-1 (serine sensor receptor)